MVLKILVGLPACGKSTFANKLRVEENYLVYSSDKYRGRLGVDAPNNVVFDTLMRDLKASLLAGNSCVFDALNLSRKRRKNIIRIVRDGFRKRGMTLRVECELFVVPTDICIERNNLRANKKDVTDSVIIGKQSCFETPWYSDGFDEIHVHPIRVENLNFNRDSLDEFGQDNPHHTLTLGGHWRKAHNYIAEKYIFTESYPFLLEAIKYHDDGKFFTKEFRESVGNATEVAHYYSHENVSAYLFLQRAFCLGIYESGTEYPLTDWGKLYVANLINWHMRPRLWSNEKVKLKDESLLGEEMIKDLLILKEADTYAK